LSVRRLQFPDRQHADRLSGCPRCGRTACGRRGFYAPRQCESRKRPLRRGGRRVVSHQAAQGGFGGGGAACRTPLGSGVPGVGGSWGAWPLGSHDAGTLAGRA
jgi:hypothetical protein